MAVVDDVREALEQTVPDFSDRSGDWVGVLAMAQTGEGNRLARAGCFPEQQASTQPNRARCRHARRRRGDGLCLRHRA